VIRRTTVPFYALVLLTEVVWIAIVPLAPDYAHRFHLSRVATGAVLAAAGFAVLVVSLPIGLLSDRFGTRTLVLASAGLSTAATFAQALATGFWTLLVARAVFGVALGAIWTAGLAWFAEAGIPESTAALGFPMTVAGVGIVVGPAFAGLLAQETSLRVPFFVLGAFGVVLTLALLRTPRVAPTRHARDRVRTTLGKTRRDAILLASLAVMVLVGLASGSINLLVPLQLRGDGLSTGATGLVMSASSFAFVLASAIVARGAQFVRLRVAAIAALVYGATLVLAAADQSAPAVITFVLVRAPFWAALSTLAYPLGAVGARRASVGPGAMNGLLNLFWGAAGTIGPVAAGAVAHARSPAWVFAALAVLCAAVGSWLLAAAAAEPTPAQPAEARGS
jgi:predicted MFS family arabinose efflux permease